MRSGSLAALTILAASVAGCASDAAPERPLPAWFVERQAELRDEGFPDLLNVPDRVDANTDPTHWAQVQAELDAVGAEVRASPRSEPPPAPATLAADVQEFDENARGAIENTRRRY